MPIKFTRFFGGGGGLTPVNIADLTIAEVLSMSRTHSRDEMLALRAEEQSGRARVTLLRALDERIEQQFADEDRPAYDEQADQVLEHDCWYANAETGERKLFRAGQAVPPGFVDPAEL